jgi:hypothetical protein
MEDIDILDPVDSNSDPDIYTDPNADYDGDPSNSLQKEWNSNYEPETTERRIQSTVRPTRQILSHAPATFPLIIL